MNIYNIITLLLSIILGGLSLYLKTKNQLLNSAGKKIAEAEKIYQDAAKSGGAKFEWVVNILYKNIPSPLRTVFTKEIIEHITQKAFDSMQSYAALQLDKNIHKLSNTTNKTE